ncbi:MAG: SAM-dependent methyltransferase, partial [Micrococcales bacterium]|nr:SAM-dependent methyltransferase [Micrococcales bacterium]NBR61508.1 SAM-dependent methyltransferase [Actinomycetota bacterium]
RNIGPLEIKKRGTDVTPEQLRKELNLKGKNPATLIITRVNDNHRVLVVAPR